LRRRLQGSGEGQERAPAARREEAEKFNVWVAWLNLENLYGQPPGEAAMALFRRALPHVNQKRLYLALLAILERTGRARPPSRPPPRTSSVAQDQEPRCLSERALASRGGRCKLCSVLGTAFTAAAMLGCDACGSTACAQRERERQKRARMAPCLRSRPAEHARVVQTLQDELAAEALRALCRKFGGSAKAWLRQLDYLLRRGEGEAARRALERALAALPTRKHLKARPCASPPVCCSVNGNDSCPTGGPCA
jgi:hypothetical protein